MTDVPAKVDMAGLEKEFGLEGNAPVEQSSSGDEIQGAELAGKSADDALETLAGRTPDGEIDVRTIERTISREQLIEGMDDNLAIAEALAKEEAEAAAAAEEESGADEDGEAEEGGEDEGGEEGAEAAADADEGGDADGAEAAASDDGGDEGDDAASDADGADGEEEAGFDAWVEEHLSEPADRNDLAQSLVEAGAELSFEAEGQTHTLPIKEILQRAAGFMGQAKVTQTFQEAKRLRTEADTIKSEAERSVTEAQATVEAVTRDIEDPTKFGTFLVANAELDYLKTMQGVLEGAIHQAEDNPLAFQMMQRMGSLEGKLDAIANRGTTEKPAPASSQDGDKPDTSSAAATVDPSTIPADRGFSPGEGYPEHLTGIVFGETRAILEGAAALGVPEAKIPDMRNVIDAWKAGGRKQPITDVAKGLLQQGQRDSRKRATAKDPPVRKRAKGGRVKTGQKKPNSEGSKPASAPTWDSIEANVKAELDAVNAGRELQS